MKTTKFTIEILPMTHYADGLHLADTAVNVMYAGHRFKALKTEENTLWVDLPTGSLAGFDLSEEGVSFKFVDGVNGIETEPTPDTITLTITPDQLATIIHALGIAERHVTAIVTQTCVGTINVRNHIPTAEQTAMQAELNRMAWGFADLNVRLSVLEKS